MKLYQEDDDFLLDLCYHFLFFSCFSSPFLLYEILFDNFELAAICFRIVVRSKHLLCLDVD